MMNTHTFVRLVRAAICLLVIPMLIADPAGASPAGHSLSTESPAVALPSGLHQAKQSTFEDPEGRFSVVVPRNWLASPAQGYSTLTDPDGAITVHALSVEGNNAEEGIQAAWARVDPAFALQAARVETPPREGVEQVARITYQTDDPQRAVSATGQLVQGRVYVILTEGAADAVARRQSQLTIIETGYDIKAVETVDLTGVAPKPFDDQMQAELEAYIAEAMSRASIPGAAVAIVQNGQIVYERGFGVRELGQPDPITPNTRMMIGSIGKTMTTMMMATVVDDGKMTWDTPAQQIYPNFSVANPQLSRQITVRNLVCACTGVPRRDLDLIFNSSQLTAENIVASLRSFEFFTQFGEAYQYSNQMVATGGYLAALAGGGDLNDLHGGYLAQMQQRIFDPIGMANTTFSFEAVRASSKYATPHGVNLQGEYSPLPLSYEQSLAPIAPAGASWSTAHDMARYALTELDHGLAPDGNQVVSAANLEETWRPQVPITAQASYGLGWVVDQYKGLRLIHHGGNTFGFTSDLAFLPEADLGIVVLANGGYSNNFNQAVRFRLFELAFGQSKAYDAQFVYQPKRITGEMAPPLADLDPVAIAPHLGAYRNEALGDVTLRLENGKLLFDAGEFVTGLRALANPLGGVQYIVFDPILAGLPVEFRMDEGGEPSVILHDPPTFTFTRIKTTTDAPAPTDLSQVMPKPFDAQMQADLGAYIATLMQREQVPGAAVAVVQNGQVVHQQGFGVRELGKPDPVTPETVMMIGSTGKSMTTMMMGTVVDDGKMSWDTPAISILPTFALSDPNLTSQITMRHLVCNCTGVERRDIEMFFSNSPRTAEGMIEGLRTFSFSGPFGQSYRYSNQMVAAGGYLAARAASPTPSNLYDDYLAQMQQRVFDPIGMPSTTFSFEAAQANPNHATPHGRMADRQLTPISLQLEQPLQPIAPAGSSWSNVQDLARYLITQLNQGVAPDGTRVVSADNLNLTWQPQVQSALNAWYALGWGVGAYKGARLLSHSGGTSGFTSDLTFFPDANLGIAILSNAQDNHIFIAGVRARVLELAYGLPMEADAGLAQRSAQMQQAIRDQIAQLPPHLDQAAIAPYQGVYTNPSLGQVKLALQGEKFVLDAGTLTTELRNAGNGTYLVWDPPLIGMKVKLDQDAAGQPTWQFISEDPDQPGTYPFTRLTPSPPSAATADEVVAWIQQAAHPLNTVSPNEPLDDLAPLREIVGDAEIIGLGEATHGSSEFFTMKHRLVKYLVEEMGFTTFVLEMDGPIGLALDEHILNGTGDPQAILDFPWRTQEMLDLIEWMRLYNADPQNANKVRFAGMDVQQITPEMFDSVTRLIPPDRPDLLQEIEQRYQGLRAAPGKYETYFGIPLETKTQYAAQAQQVVELLKQHRAALEQSSSPEEFAWGLHNAQGISQFARMMELFETDPGQGFTYHDQAMAENAAWWHGQTGKTIVSAHNGHVAHQTMLPQIYPDKVMGTFLRERFGERYVSLGMSFGQGQFNARTRTESGVSCETTAFNLGAPIPDSSNAVLQAAGIERYLLDLRPAPEPVQAWLAEPRPFRIAAAAVSADPQEREAQSYAIGSLRQWFDLIIHLDQVTAANPTVMSLPVLTSVD